MTALWTGFSDPRYLEEGPPEADVRRGGPQLPDPVIRCDSHLLTEAVVRRGTHLMAEGDAEMKTS